ncbi:hypothetical protein SpCBS45565_g08482 [Spizellomyces sp. 'palustris']|nr:hypothetical protein SpCBS45565_g08482 [Spizellomyces sp. 'palustris']
MECFVEHLNSKSAASASSIHDLVCWSKTCTESDPFSPSETLSAIAIPRIMNEAQAILWLQAETRAPAGIQHVEQLTRFITSVDVTTTPYGKEIRRKALDLLKAKRTAEQQIQLLTAPEMLEAVRNVYSTGRLTTMRGVSQLICLVRQCLKIGTPEAEAEKILRNLVELRRQLLRAGQDTICELERMTSLSPLTESEKAILGLAEHIAAVRGESYTPSMAHYANAAAKLPRRFAYATPVKQNDGEVGCTVGGAMYAKNKAEELGLFSRRRVSDLGVDASRRLKEVDVLRVSGDAMALVDEVRRALVKTPQDVLEGAAIGKTEPAVAQSDQLGMALALAENNMSSDWDDADLLAEALVKAHAPEVCAIDATEFQLGRALCVCKVTRPTTLSRHYEPDVAWQVIAKMATMVMANHSEDTPSVWWMFNWIAKDMIGNKALVGNKPITSIVTWRIVTALAMGNQSLTQFMLGLACIHAAVANPRESNSLRIIGRGWYEEATAQLPSSQKCACGHRVKDLVGPGWGREAVLTSGGGKCCFSPTLMQCWLLRPVAGWLGTKIATCAKQLEEGWYYDPSVGTE